MGGAQREASSGQCIVRGEQRRNGSPTNVFYVNGKRGGMQQFRSRRESSREIVTVDSLGNRHSRRHNKHLGITPHTKILEILANRARRFLPQMRLTQEEEKWDIRIDETGTMVLSEEVLGRNRMMEARVAEERELREINDEVLEMHGIQPGKKPEGVVRLIYENANGIDGRFGNNRKVEKAKELHNNLEVDIAAYNEHRLNMQHKHNKVGFSQLFWGGEAEVRSVVGHNVHTEKKRRIQEGGTSMLMFGKMIDYYDRTQSGRDESDLGRWVVMTLKGDTTTRIVCGYNPCGNDKTNSGTVYHQQRQYWVLKKKCLECPRVKFCNDLVDRLKEWRDQGDKLIVCMDANEDIYRKSIGKALTSVEGLAMKEVVGAFTGKQIGATYFRGSKPIDAVWATADIQVAGACIMPAGYGIGDHRLFVIDFVASSLVGETPQKIVRAQARRLNCKIPGVVERYNKRLESNIRKHRLLERMGDIYHSSEDTATKKRRLDMIDKEGKEYIQNAERRCRQFKSGVIPFSPEAAKWIRRLQVYRSLLRAGRGTKGNHGNLRRTALRAGITSPFTLSEEDILARMEICRQHCGYYKKHGKEYRKRHLQNRLKAAGDNGDEAAEKQILGIIKRERERGFWRKLKYKMGKASGGSVQMVQVEDETGNVETFSTQEEVHEAIWSNIHKKRFFLAESAPICSGHLREIFGYNSDTAAADEVLDGTFQFDEITDAATRDICEEVARIGGIIPKDSLSDTVKKGDWAKFWSKAREETSSSESGLHFGHYKAGARSDLISHFHASKGSIMIKTGVGLDRWGRGVSVMLEKIPGCHLINKLRSILLMEADFNCLNKMIFGCRMLANVRKYQIMPDEIFSEQNRTAEEGSLSKVLFYDIVRQTRLPAGISSVDADNCYDRVAHAIAALVFRSFGVSQSATNTMPKTIQDMKFFLRTAFGDSKSFAGALMDIKTQGLCQGNGAAPASWAVVSIVILNAHKKRGHGAKFVCPMSLVKSGLAAVLFVDDTDVIHLDMERKEDKYEALDGLQNSVNSWGELLAATGGSLKPSKCFFHLISFEWNADGTWCYARNEKDEAIQLTIPLADGSQANIQHCGVHEAHKTLGTMTCPSGSNDASITRMKALAQEWIDQATAAHLSRNNFWFLMKVQLKPKIFYGIGACSASYGTLAECLLKQYYNMIPLGGVRRSANRSIRQLDTGFFGLGCPHPAIECLVAQTNRLLTHYGCETSVGRLLQTSIEYFIMELGMGPQPFQVDFAKHGMWVTDSWIKSLWEKLYLFGIEVEEGKLKIRPPRERDEWLMTLFIKLDYNPIELIRLNRVRQHQEVLFLSDVMDARGTIVEKKYEYRRPENERWSQYNFPLQNPPDKDFRLWKRALEQLRYVRSSRTLGRFLWEGKKIWDWRYEEEEQRVYHYHAGGMDIYTPSEVPRYTNRANCWTRSRVDQLPVKKGVICSTKAIALGVWKVTSQSPRDTPIPTPDKLEEVFERWGCSWLWDDLRWQGERTWLPVSIWKGDCMVVADGSYMPNLRKGLCSTAFFFECKAGRGRLVGSFAEFSASANAYRGELLGLMAIHLILRGVAELHPRLSGKVEIFSDCAGALDKLSNLPPHCLPSKCKHSDILKNILLNCCNLPFQTKLTHIPAHQDDKIDFRLLSRPAQLNCAVDAGAKQRLMEAAVSGQPCRQRFPLEAIACFVGKEKMTTDTSSSIHFWAHRRLARVALIEGKILSERQFDAIAWEAVSAGLHSTPTMFQMWASKQVWDIASTNYLRSKWDKTVDKLCPRCRRAKETAEHIVSCSEDGRVKVMQSTIDLVEKWLTGANTAGSITNCIIQYTRGRGYRTMQEICNSMGGQFQEMAKEQDTIGWRRFMEGMISKKLVCIYEDYHALTGEGLSSISWASQLVVHLLEVNGQWIYRNIQVHDDQQGTLRTQEKEAIQRQIEVEMELGFNNFLPMDKSLADVTLEDLETSDGRSQEYWLIAVKTARAAAKLSDQAYAVDTQPD